MQTYQQVLDAAKVTRSTKWAAVRKAHLKSQPCCQVCGASSLLNVHHIKPFHLFPELELQEDNLITLCEGTSVNCHLLMGHLMNWRAWNPAVVSDTERMRKKIMARLAA